MLKVAFVHVLSYNEPLGIMYLSSYIKNKIPDLTVKLFDPTRKSFYTDIRSYDPDVIGYSVVTGWHQTYLRINQKLKQMMKFISVFGGPHPTYFPEFIWQDGVDTICRGEGEEPMYQLCCSVQTQSLVRKDIDNLWIKEPGGGIMKNEICNAIEDLDSIPFPGRDLIYDQSDFLRIHRMKSFISSRGCPFRCSYCYNDALLQLYSGKGRYFRQRSPHNVIEEILEVKARYPLQFIQFFDDTFAVS
jgi:radical SAM superfamily enzyme YgiQ (UPF0313 family)